ncbi:MAG: hypothetical protein QOE58_3378 [Actinomycetota bacterium]|jgi:ketosteroid isomerase-like protein|nr:hypothetical protein [Actinomycetota bacterium]
MSEENVELVRALLPQPDADIIPLFRDEETFARLLETVSPLLTDDFAHVMVSPAETRTDAGLDGLRKNWLDWLEPWTAYRSTADELIEVGDRVVALLRNFARRQESDREVELLAAAIFTFKEGKLARWEDYTNRAQALEAAGLGG